jgi:HEAT repeat protein
MSPPSPPETEIERRIEAMLAPSGDVAYGRVREAALQYLLQHADEAHPRLLEWADRAEPPVLVLLALARFGRPESVPVLERALANASDPTTVIAAQALAEHPAPAAREALERALASLRHQVVASAANGLAERGDPAACPALATALSHPDAEVRERLREAMATLGCTPG